MLGLDDIACAPAFAAPVTYPTATGPRALAVTDLDANGRLDIVTANSGGNNLSQFFGNGDGTVAEKADQETVAAPTDLAAGDVTGDGVVDLAVLSTSSNSLMVMRGQGAAGLVMDASYMLTTGRDVEVADLDRNGTLDVVVASVPTTGGEVSVFLAQPDGTLAPSVNYPTPGQALVVRIADFTRDGILDLLVCGRLDNNMFSVFPGVGDGSFGTRIDTMMGPNVTSIVVGDVTSDDNPDLLVGTVDVNLGSMASLLTGAPDGTFAIGAPASSTLLPFALTHLDRDDILDLVTYDITKANPSPDVSIQLGIGDGTFDAPTTHTLPAQPLSLTVANIDVDSVPEIIGVLANNTLAIVDGGCAP